MTEPTTEKLARALIETGAPEWMIQKARDGYYDDFKSPLSMPIFVLVRDAKDQGLASIAQRAASGEFDASKEESEAWANSPEGQAAFQELLGGGNRAERRRARRRR